MKCLIVGHEGYVGSGLTKYFKRRGHDTSGWGRKEDIFSLTPAFFTENRFDVVVNCATAQNRTDQRYNLEGADHRISVKGTEQLVRALQPSATPLVHISTKDVFGEVYGTDDVVERETRLEPKFLIREGQKFSPLSVYAKTKLISEWIAEAHERTNIVRLSTVYTNDHHRNGNWIVKFIEKVSAGEPITITRGGKQVRDPLHVEDLGALIERMVETGKWGVTVHAGGGPSNTVSILEVLHRIDPTVRPQASDQKGDLGFAFSLDRAKEIFDWSPQVRLWDRLPALIDTVKRARG